MRLVGKADIERHLRHRLAKPQQAPRLLDPDLGEIGVGGEPKVFLEQPDEMERADAGGAGGVLKVDVVAGMRLQKGNRAADRRRAGRRLKR